MEWTSGALHVNGTNFLTAHWRCIACTLSIHIIGGATVRNKLTILRLANTRVLIGVTQAGDTITWQENVVDSLGVPYYHQEYYPNILLHFLVK